MKIFLNMDISAAMANNPSKFGMSIHKVNQAVSPAGLSSLHSVITETSTPLLSDH